MSSSRSPCAGFVTDMSQASLVPLRLKEMLPSEIQETVARDPRLLVPVGTCEPHGKHLPMGCDTLIAERLCDELSAEVQILRAPTLEYGVMTPHDRLSPGASGLRRKALLRMLNDLIETWEAGGIREFILVTAHGHEGHLEALSTVITRGARVQAVDILGMELPELSTGRKALHGDEADTSLMLHLFPHLVEMARAADFDPRRTTRRQTLKVPRDSPGSLGSPSQASATTGEAIYRRIKRLVRDRILMAPADEDE
ncbi:MAG: creatininase family protein [Gemmatimonadetes bacterium]|nr:creatininase family protein [Gemmatimonadota bacterium]